MEITLLCLLVNSAALSESVGAVNFQELFSKSVGVLIFQRSFSQLQQSMLGSLLCGCPDREHEQ